MKRMNKRVLEGLNRLVSAYEAGGGCEDVGGGCCEGDNCKECDALKQAAEWLTDRILKFTKQGKR